MTSGEGRVVKRALRVAAAPVVLLLALGLVLLGFVASVVAWGCWVAFEALGDRWAGGADA